jgi:hypothetical protein
MAKLARSKPAPHLLVTWIGQTDLNASAGLKDAGKGPIGQAVTQRTYDRVVLLCNYPKKDAARFVAWLEQQSPTKIELNLVELASPTHFGEIYEGVTRLVARLLHEYGADARLTYHLSPGRLL